MSAVQNLSNSADLRCISSDPRASSQRVTRSLRRALADADVRQCVADALTLEGLARSSETPLRAAFEVLVRDASDRAPWGLDDPAAVVADLCAWAQRGDLEPTLAFAVAAMVLGETHAHRGARPVAMVAIEDPHDASRAVADVLDHRLAEAEARARRMTRELGAEALLRSVIVPAIAHDLAALGDAAAQITRAWSLVERFPEASEDVMAAAAVMLTVTRSCVRAGGGFTPVEPSAGTPIAAPADALHDAARAVALRLRAMGTAPRDATHLELSRALRMVHAATRLLPLCDDTLAATLAAQCAGVVERLPAPGPIAPRAERAPHTLEEAFEARDLAAARAAAQGLGPLDVFRRLSPFAAVYFTVRPYHVALAVQSVEALRDFAVSDPTHAADYADAALALTVPWRVERALSQIVSESLGR